MSPEQTADTSPVSTNGVSRTLAVALLVALCGACGASGNPAPTQEQLALSSIQGAWLCDVQRFAFDDLTEIDARLDDQLATAGFSRSAHDTFTSDLDSRSDLRQLVVDSFSEACDK